VSGRMSAKTGLAPRALTALACGYEGEGREEDFVTWLNAARAEGQNQCVGSGS